MKRPYKVEQYRLSLDWGISYNDAFISGVRFPNTSEGERQAKKIATTLNVAFAKGAEDNASITADELSIYKSTLKWYADQDIGGSAREALRQVEKK